MKCSVYIIYSIGHRKSYVGISEDVQRRLAEHNRRSVKSTKPFVPWILVYEEVVGTITEARIKEKYLKSAAGRRWRKKNIKIDMGD